ncbi:MAG: peptidoglycan-binding domain-containing protein [Hyphomicrobiaceae bacterium]
MQTELKTRRFLDDKVDGVFGRKTRFAIAAWEHSVGLPSRLVCDVLTGVRTMPAKCDRGRFLLKKIVPSYCKTFGLEGLTSLGDPT